MYMYPSEEGGEAVRELGLEVGEKYVRTNPGSSNINIRTVNRRLMPWQS